MSADNFREGFIVPLVDAGLEEGHQRRRIKFAPGGGSPGDNIFEFGLSEAKPIKFHLKLWNDQTGQNSLDAVRNLLFDLGQLRLFRLQVGRCAVDLIGDILGGGGEIHRPQVFLQVLDDESLDFVGVDIFGSAGMGPVFVAAEIIPGDIALFIRAGVSDVPGTTFFTFDQARQQVLVTGFIFCVALIVVHPGPDLLPRFVVDDPGDGVLDALYVGIRLAACPFAHDLALLFVPGVNADIPFVLQHTVQSILRNRAATLAQGTV